MGGIITGKIRGNSQKRTRLYSLKKKAANKSKITADVVGHVLKKISRAVIFFISRSGKVVGRVLDKNATPRPFQKEDLKFY